MSKSLVVYFSHVGEQYNVGTVDTGNTEILAQEIIKKTGADEFRIVPVEAYPADYQACVDKATIEKNKNARPDYQGKVENFADYDTIYLGYPIWWGDMPMVVYKFIEDYDWAGKTVIPFNTHEGSGNSGTYETLQEKLAGAELKGDGFNLSGAVARTENGKNQLESWLETL